MATPNLIIARYRTCRPEQYHGWCHVRSAGHYRVVNGFRDAVMKKDFLELFWGVRGSGCFEISGKTVKLSQGETCCYFPGDVHKIYTDAADWEYYWVTLDGATVTNLIKTFSLQREPWTAGRCPVELFEKIILALSDIGNRSLHQAASVAYELFSLAANGPWQGPSDHNERLKLCIEQNFNNPEFSIDIIARQSGMHRTTLYRHFARQTGVSPQHYLTACRLREALARMREGQTLKEIAFECGFTDQNYFSRVFRQNYGTTPTKFRRELN